MSKLIQVLKDACDQLDILKEEIINLEKKYQRLKRQEFIDAVKLVKALNHSEIPNSSDCIDRAEAQTAIQFAARRYTVAHEAHGEGHVVWSDNLISVTDAMNALREVPSAQPEREKGKWIPVTKIYKVTEDQFPKTHIEWVDATEPDEIDAVRCSECGEVFDFQDARNWCTECGADMRGEQDEINRC